MMWHVLQTLSFHLEKRVPKQPAAVVSTLDLWASHLLQLDDLQQCGTQSLPDTFTHDQHWESNCRLLIASLMFSSFTQPCAPLIPAKANKLILSYLIHQESGGSVYACTCMPLIYTWLVEDLICLLLLPSSSKYRDLHWSTLNDKCISATVNNILDVLNRRKDCSK